MYDACTQAVQDSPRVTSIDGTAVVNSVIDECLNKSRLSVALGETELE